VQSDAVIFAHISDTHFGPVPWYERHGYASAPCAERLVDTLNALPFGIDFVIHTGDVVTDPDDQSYQLAAATLGRIDAPVYYVTGNHDTAPQIRKYLAMGPCEHLVNADDLLTYAFEVRGQRFLTVDARAPVEMDPEGLLSAAQLAVLDRELGPEGPPLTVFCHFLPLPVGVPWIDRMMLIRNGLEMHRRIVIAGSRIRGVFAGHVHQAMIDYRGGVLYSTAPSAFAQLSGNATDLEPLVDDVSPPGFAIVRLEAGRTLVRLHALARP
jgi:Icc protein